MKNAAAVSDASTFGWPGSRENMKHMLVSLSECRTKL
jgi:hypothetical protein